MAKDKILVVDDEQMNRWSLAKALRGWDYEVAEEYLKEFDPHLEASFPIRNK